MGNNLQSYESAEQHILQIHVHKIAQYPTENLALYFCNLSCLIKELKSELNLILIPKE